MRMPLCLKKDLTVFPCAKYRLENTIHQELMFLKINYRRRSSNQSLGGLLFEFSVGGLVFFSNFKVCKQIALTPSKIN